MRDIKFRALNVDTKQWVYFALAGKTGNISIQLVQLDSNLWAQPEDMATVYTALTEYTGLKDKNGVEIYESDIVRVSGIITGAEGLRPGFVWSDDDVFVMAWDNDIAAWSVQDEDFDTTDVVSVTYRNQAIQLIQNGSGEIIGNIYENPELLTGVKPM